MKDRLKDAFPLILFALTIVLTINESYGDAFLAFFIMLAIIFFRLFNVRFNEDGTDETISHEIKPAIGKTAYCTYYGDELNFSDYELIAILNKRFPYFASLSPEEQPVFLKRLKKFIASKTFKIHGNDKFKEMLVLVSATAIQLTFGLKKYLLPHFEFIHIFPQEFLRVSPVLCFLEGNVSGHSINLSWKHFLEGYARPEDGQNVGLHELAHALYYQTFIVEENVDKGFRNFYNNFNAYGNKAYHTEKTIAGGLYSEYAEKNFQEFWAESVEIFFEKPVEMKAHYAQLYETMKILLKQDPIRYNQSLG